MLRTCCGHHPAPLPGRSESQRSRNKQDKPAWLREGRCQAFVSPSSAAGAGAQIGHGTWGRSSPSTDSHISHPFLKTMPETLPWSCAALEEGPWARGRHPPGCESTLLLLQTSSIARTWQGQAFHHARKAAETSSQDLLCVPLMRRPHGDCAARTSLLHLGAPTQHKEGHDEPACCPDSDSHRRASRSPNRQTRSDKEKYLPSHKLTPMAPCQKLPWVHFHEPHNAASKTLQ